MATLDDLKLANTRLYLSSAEMAIKALQALAKFCRDNQDWEGNVTIPAELIESLTNAAEVAEKNYYGGLERHKDICRKLQARDN